MANEQLPFGSAYLFNADAQAILEDAPDYETGLELLSEAQKQVKWDNPEEVAKTASDYGQALRFRFGDKDPFDAETLAHIQPINLSEVNNDITEWEKANLDFLSTTSDPDYTPVKDKLKQSIELQASSMRRDQNVKDTAAGNYLSGGLNEKFYRFLEGGVGGLLKLVGAEDTLKGIHERTDPSKDDDLSSTLASAGGTVTGVLAASAVNPALGYAYLAGQGAGEVRDVYERSMEVTGDSGRATLAAAIEGGNQAVQAFTGAKVFGTTGRAIAKRVFGREVKELGTTVGTQVLKKGAAEGTVEGVGQVVSNAANRYGQDDPRISLTQGTENAAIAGFVFGSAAGGIDAAMAHKGPTAIDPSPPPIEKDVIGGVVSDNTEPPPNPSFVTKDGSQYTVTPEGSTARYKIETKENFEPFDATFFVNKETAEKLAALRNLPTPDGKTPQILTDGNGNLLVKSDHLNEDLTPSEKPTGSRLTVVPVEKGAGAGLYPVEVNRPKNTNGVEREYRSHIGQEIAAVRETEPTGQGVGAEFTKERKVSERVRLNDDVSETIREGLGGPDGGWMRYVPQPLIQSANKAVQWINDRGGLEGATRDFLTSTEIPDMVTANAGAELIQRYSDGVKNALADGDTIAAEKNADMAMRVTEKLAQLGTTSGQFIKGLEALKFLSPEARTVFLQKQLKDAAIEEVATEEGVTPNELNQTDAHLTQIDEEVKKIQTDEQVSRNAVEGTEDTAIQDSTKIIGEIEKKGKEQHQEFVKQETEKIKRAEEAAKQIEDKAKEAFDAEATAIDEGVKEAEARISEIEKKAQEKVQKEKTDNADAERLVGPIEEKALKKAQDDIETKIKKTAEEFDKKIEVAESAIKKLEENQKKGAKVKPETIEAKKKAIEQLKVRKENEVNSLKERKAKVTAEEGLSPEERKMLRDLKVRKEKAKTAPTPTKENVLTESERKEIQRLKENVSKAKERKATQKEPKLSDAQKKRINKLNQIVKARKERVAKTTPDDFVSSRDLNQKTALIKRRDELRGKKAERQRKGQSYLSDPQKARLKELLGKKESLKKRKDKVDTRQKERLKKLTPELQKQYGSLVEASRKTGGGLQQDALRAAHALEAKVLGKVPYAQKNALYSFFQANLLSNPSTQIKNILGNIYQYISGLSSLIATGNFKDAGELLRGSISGIGEGVTAAKAELKGVKTFRAGEIDKKVDVDPTSDFVTEAPTFFQKTKLNMLGHVFRVMGAADAFFYHTAQEGLARAKAAELSRNEGLSGEALKEKIANYLFNSEENFAAAEAQAKVEAQYIEDAIGKKPNPNQVKLRAWEILEQQRDPNIRKEARNFARKSTFTNDPEGAIGGIIKGLNVIAQAPVKIGSKEVRPIRYAIPFLKVAGNIANAQLDYVPIFGGVRLFSKGMTPLEHKMALGKFLIGTTLAGTLYGLAKEGLIEVHGGGPDDLEKKKQLQDQGWKPYSIQIGNNYIRYPESPLGALLGAIGAIRDKETYSKAYSKTEGLTTAATLFAGMGKSFMDNSFLRGVSTLLDTLTGDKGPRAIESFLANQTKGFVPASGALKQITKLTNDPIDTSQDFWSKFISGVPFVQSAGTRPALNAFGKPLERSLEDRIDFVGAFYSHRASDPNWRWLGDNGYFIPATGSGYTISLPVSKRPDISKKRAAKYGAAFDDVLTQDERYEFIEKSGPLVEKIVDKYRRKYGTSGYRESVQKDMSEEISKARSEVKAKLFLK